MKWLWDFLWSAAIIRRFGFLFGFLALHRRDAAHQEKPKQKPKAANNRRTPKKIPKHIL